MIDRSFLIQLTSAVYRLTLLFPKKEPLRYKMREIADDILAKPNEKDLEVLDSFFEVSLIQNWVKPTDILAIKGEYDNLRERLKGNKPEREVKEDKFSFPPFAGAREGEEEKPSSLPFAGAREGDESLLSSSPLTNARERKEKILSFLRENEKAQVWQIKQLLSEVSKRTLRRDFEDMVEQGLIERMGERNDTFYKIKNQVA